MAEPEGCKISQCRVARFLAFSESEMSRGRVCVCVCLVGFNWPPKENNLQLKPIDTNQLVQIAHLGGFYFKTNLKLTLDSPLKVSRTQYAACPCWSGSSRPHAGASKKKAVAAAKHIVFFCFVKMWAWS